MAIAGAALWIPATNIDKLFPQSRLNKTIPRRKLARAW